MMRQHNICCVCVCVCVLCGEVCWNQVQPTSPHRTYAHTPNVMLPHHHFDFLHL